jgi:hypothetical protein
MVKSFPPSLFTVGLKLGMSIAYFDVFAIPNGINLAIAACNNTYSRYEARNYTEYRALEGNKIKHMS